MIAVGIDVSKSKSTVAILNGDGSIRAKPFDVHHVADELQALVDYIKRTSEPRITSRGLPNLQPFLWSLPATIIIHF